MLAVTLAAGMGTRMHELTTDTPKTMLPFLGKSLLSYQQALFKSFSIPQYVVGGYKAEKLNVNSEKLIINHRYSETNMAYSLLLALKKVFQKNPKSDVIVSYGDIIYSKKNLEILIQCSKGDMQISADLNFISYWNARMEDPLQDLESFKVDPKTSMICSIGEDVKQVADIEAQYIGLFKISADFIPRLIKLYEGMISQNPGDEKLSMTELLQTLIVQKKMESFPVFTKGGWLEFDSCEDLKVYENLVNENKLAEFYNA